MKSILIIVIFILNNYNVFSLNICDSLQSLKELTYGFKPSSINDSIKEQKSKEMDIFWETAKSHPADAAKCIKIMIENEKHDSFFCFDASSLLLRLDTTDKYLPTVIQGINKCELEDLQLYPYLQICIYLGKKNQDISDLVSKFLDLTEGKIFLSNHFLELGIVDASIFMLNIIPIEKAETILINKINSNNYNIKHNGIYLLNLLSSNNGDKIINDLIKNKNLNDSTIQLLNQINKKLVLDYKEGTLNYEKVIELLDDAPFNFEKQFYGFSGNTDLINSACSKLTSKDLEKLFEARKKSTFNLSDEALYEYYALTSIIMTVKKK